MQSVQHSIGHRDGLGDSPPVRTVRPRRLAASLIVFAGCCAFLTISSGCINSFVMFGKVLMGDPIQPSGFEVLTGVNLKKAEKRILIHCSAPAFLASDYDTLTAEVQNGLQSRLRRRKIAMISPDRVADVLDDFSGRFDPNLLASKIDDVDYLFHIQFDSFSHQEANSPNLYRGNATGRIVGYEARGQKNQRHAVQVYDQRFNTVHPSTHPVTVDQMPKNVFIRRFIDRINDDLGHTFYGVHNSDLFVN